MSIQEQIYLYTIGEIGKTEEIKDFIKELNKWTKTLTK